MATLFLEPDDEITIAVGRMREAGERQVALVLPAGSRIASSRINFRLLAREAEALGTQLTVISPEATARALASAAGLPTFSAVSRYEAAVAGGVAAAGEGGADDAAPVGAPGPPPAFIPVTREPMRAPGVDRSPTIVAPPPGSPAGPAPARAARPARGSPLSRIRGRGLAVALVGLVIVGAGTAAAGTYYLLPEARVTVTPRIETFGPLVFQVTADPDAKAIDAATGIVPATWQETTVDAQDTFDATGVKVTDTNATGSVTFSNYGNQNAQSIPAGSTVKTKQGTAFATKQGVVVPKGTVDPVTHVVSPGTASVAIEAARAGTSGNVAAGAITVIPKGYNQNLLQVTNPQATTGGSHLEEKVVQQSDYDAAVTALTEKLRQSFDEWVRGGAGLTVAGSLLIDDSAVLDAPRFDQAPEVLIGTVGDTFDLAAEADGRVLTLDTGTLTVVGAARYRQKTLPAGYTEVSTSVTHERIESADPAKPIFEVSATGRAYRDLDAAALEQLILGRPLDEARAALEPYGDATVTLSPGWFGVVPQLDWRVSVEVVVPPGAS